MTERKPKVSVVIPTKNPGPLFRRVLHAVLSQDAPFTFEVVVIDSGSTDGTLEYLRSHAAVRLIEIEPASFGHGRTRNLAISHSAAQYVAMLTHDALPASKSWLSSLVTVAETDERIAGVFGCHLPYPEASLFTKRELEMHFEGFRQKPLVEMEDPQRYQREPGYRQFLHFFSDNNALLRRRVWEKIPYPDVDFAEDQVWAKLIIEAGYRKGYSHEGAVFHSHNYGLLERLQRSFDESFAFRQFFGYRLCPNVPSLLGSWLRLSRRDLRYAFKEGLWRTEPAVVARQPLDQWMRTLGHYLGTHGHRLPESLRVMLSRDKKLKASTRMASGL